MCFQGQSTTTIGNPTIPEPGANGKRPDWVDTTEQKTIEKARADIAQGRANAGLKDEPDFSDGLIKEARKRQASQLLAKSNRRDALANNPGSYSLLK